MVLTNFFGAVSRQDFFRPLVVRVLCHVDKLRVGLRLGIQGTGVEELVVIARVLVRVRDRNLLLQFGMTVALSHGSATLTSSREFVSES
jgi:hypothetical protein